MLGLYCAFPGSSKALAAETRVPRKPTFDPTTFMDCANLAEPARYKPPQCLPELLKIRFMSIWTPASAGPVVAGRLSVHGLDAL